MWEGFLNKIVLTAQIRNNELLNLKSPPLTFLKTILFAECGVMLMSKYKINGQRKIQIFFKTIDLD
jgi:hypothetical protein